MRKLKSCFLVALLLSLASLGLTCRRKPSGSATTEIKRIVLISLDTCRADYLGCYGCDQAVSPNIDALARENILFENAISPVPMTLPSHSSIMTGLTPPSHGIHDNFQSLAQSHTTLAESLKARGMTTAAFLGSFVLDSQFGLDQGFDTYKDDFPQKPGPIFVPFERRGGEVSDFACKWLAENKEKDFFLFLHYYDPHDPYRPPEPFLSQFSQTPYAGEIAYTDHCLGRVIQQLKTLDLYDSGEQRPLYCESLTPTEYNCNPLLAVVSYPWKYIHTTRDELYNLSIDPCESINLAQKEISHTRRLKQELGLLLQQYREPDDSRSEALDQASLNRLRSLGYVGDGVVKSFEIDEDKADPKDLLNLHLQKKTLMNALRLREFDKAEELCAELLGRHPSQPFLHELAGRISVGKNQTAQAARHFQRYVQLKPEDPRGRNDLATTLCKLGKYREALGHLEAALSDHPNPYLIHKNLASTYNALSKMPQAIEHWREAIRLRPHALNLYNYLAWILATRQDAEIRDPKLALQLAKHACEKTNFANPQYLDTLAAAYACDGLFRRAVDTEKKAIDLLGPNDLESRREMQSRLQLYQSNRPYRKTTGK